MKTLALTACVSLLLLAVACGDDGISKCDDGCPGGAGGTSAAATTASNGSNQSGNTATTGTMTATGSTTQTAAQTNSATSTGNAMADAEVNLTFTGTCAPDFGGMLVVASNSDSVAVTATTGNFSSVQLALQDPPASIAISTAERVANGDVINVVSQNTTWSNISSAEPDPIAGTLVVHDYQEQAGIFDVVFQNVILENVQNQSLCTVNGTIKAFGNSF